MKLFGVFCIFEMFGGKGWGVILPDMHACWSEYVHISVICDHQQHSNATDNI